MLVGPARELLDSAIVAIPGIATRQYVGFPKPNCALVAYPREMAETASKAASDWKLRVGKVDTEAGLAMAKDLPQGSLFPSSKMEPPVIKRETYNLLLKTINCEVATTSSKPEPAIAPRPSANPWDAIGIGSVVLAQVDKEEGYFPARVEKISGDGKTLYLKWKDYPSPPLFTMRRLVCGLIAKVK